MKKEIKKPRPLNTLYADARIEGHRVALESKANLTVKQARRLAEWLIQAFDYLDDCEK